METPKVISLFKNKKYTDCFPGISILGEPTNLFIQCVAYDLQIPVRGISSRYLNIFEEAVLRLTRLKGYNPDVLAETLALEKDLINFILACLKEKGFLDESLGLTHSGIDILNMQAEGKKEGRQIQGRLFLLKKVDQILPYIHIGEFQSEKVVDVTARQLTLGYGNIGNLSLVPGIRLRNTDLTVFKDTRLPQNRLQKAIISYNRLLSHANLKPINFRQGESIWSSRNESVYFHIQAAVQDGSTDEILFSDGFVPNIDGMWDYVRQEYPDVINDVRQRAVRMSVQQATDPDKRRPEARKYWNVERFYKSASQHLPAKSWEDATPDERKAMDEGKLLLAIDCYHLLENALFYYLKERPVPETMLGVLMRQTLAQNRETVTMMARNLGLRNVDRAARLFGNLDGRKIPAVFSTDTPQMLICLPMAIAEAKEAPDSRMRAMIGQKGNFLNFVLDLHNATRELAHDSESEAVNLEKSAESILEETVAMACALLPNLRLDGKEKSRAENPGLSQGRLLAQTSLANAFGSLRFQMMPDGLKEDWMRISPDKSGSALPDMGEYARILYRILQTELVNAKRSLPDRGAPSRAEAIQRIEKALGKPLPRTLSTVREVYYASAARDGKSSLGGEALVFAAKCGNMDQLIEADFIGIVDRLIRLRGHDGQQAFLVEDEYSMGALRDKVMELTRVIGG